MAGFLCTSPGQILGSGSNREQQYLVLTAVLYSQGESPAAIKQRLIGLGYKNPAVTVLKLADKLQESKDPQAQRQAEVLRQLSDALTVAGDTVPPVPTAIASPPAVSPTVETATAPAKPDVAATPPATATPTKNANPQPNTASSSGPTSGTIKTSGNEPAMLRTGPNTQGAPRAAIPNGTRVQILEVVTGEAADGTEKRWYRVKYGQLEGYVYSKLVVAGE